MTKTLLPTEAEFRAELAEVFPGIHWDAVKVEPWGLVAVRGYASVSVETGVDGSMRIYGVGHSNDPKVLHFGRVPSSIGSTMVKARTEFARNVRNGVEALTTLGVSL